MVGEMSGISEIGEISEGEWTVIRGGLRFGQEFTGTVVKVPRPGAIGVFVDIGLPVGGFVDVLYLPMEAERWPAEGTVARFEVWWADPKRQQIRLRPVDPAWLREDLGERPSWHRSVMGQPMDYIEETIEFLEREFRADEGSFLLRLRGDLTWDRAAFTRLERAMRFACEYFQASLEIRRWAADGFYTMATWVPAWTAHPDFPRPTPTAYYEDCLERTGDLADWFFRGESNYLEGHIWRDL